MTLILANDKRNTICKVSEELLEYFFVSLQQLGEVFSYCQHFSEVAWKILDVSSNPRKKVIRVKSGARAGHVLDPPFQIRLFQSSWPKRYLTGIK